MKFFRHLLNVLRFMQLPKSDRRITFYSEGKNYWPHLEGLVTQVLLQSDIPVCYITSDDMDPGLQLQHPRIHTFKIDEGFVRNWLFENIDTDVMVMTMPDLEQFQVKRSKHAVHYVYVQHSLVSLHMIYRKGAFDHYDTIFCAGPHHVREIRAMESRYQLPEKILLEHGYSRLDKIIKKVDSVKRIDKIRGGRPHVLLAPTWSPSGIIESGLGENIIGQLLKLNCQVTLRPHPQTIKFAWDRIDAIIKAYGKNSCFVYEADVAGEESLHNSDIMISDWSGAALEYAFGLGKPVLFADVPRKVNNEDYRDIELEPIEVSVRNVVGQLLDADSIDAALKVNLASRPEYDPGGYVFNIGSSDRVGATYLLEKLNA